MRALSLQIICGFCTISVFNVRAQIHIPSVPTDVCVTDIVTTATYSTKLTLETGSQLILAGNFWLQPGAQWTFSTDTKGLEFGAPQIPIPASQSSVPQSDRNALSLNGSKTQWTLTLPTTPPSGQDHNISFQAFFGNSPNVTDSLAGTGSSYIPITISTTIVPSGTLSGAIPNSDNMTAASVTSTSSSPNSMETSVSFWGLSGSGPRGPPIPTAFSTIGFNNSNSGNAQASDVKRRWMPAASPRVKGRGPVPQSTNKPSLIETRKPMPVGAKFRRQVVSQNFNLIIKGTWPCLQNPKGVPPTITTANPGNPTLASMCLNNDISMVSESWTAFRVNNYLSTLISSASGPSATSNNEIQVNGAYVLALDVNKPQCTYTATCPAGSCSDIKDWSLGTELSIQRYFAYTAVANLNNYLYVLDYLLTTGGLISSLMAGDVVTTFFVNPKPQASFTQMFNTVTPLISMFSSLLNVFGGFGILPGLLSGAAAIMSDISANGVIGALAPVVDKRFTEYANVQSFIANYLKSVAYGVNQAYDRLLGKNVTTLAWSGDPSLPDSDIYQQGVFEGGFWVNSNYTQGLTDHLLENMVRVFTYKMVNFALIDSGCFIVFVPYGISVKGLDGNAIQGGVDENWCNTNLKNKDHLGTLTLCDAGGGMARIINPQGITGNKILSGLPQGWNSDFPVLINETLDFAGAIRGSIASWRAGDFGYDAATPYMQEFESGNGLTLEHSKSLAGLMTSEHTAGFFNVPVAETFDLRFFPPASGSVCLTFASSFGGLPNSKAKFLTNIKDIVSKSLSSAFPGSPYCGASTICGVAPMFGSCPWDPYGPKVQQLGPNGYTPGWCGVHVTEYQVNEGPGTDRSQYRLSVKIYDGQSYEITTGNDAVVNAPAGQWISFTSKLPSPLQIKVADGDKATPGITFRYIGNPDFTTDDKTHCGKPLGGWDWGNGRQDDCGFSCA